MAWSVLCAQGKSRATINLGPATDQAKFSAHTEGLDSRMLRWDHGTSQSLSLDMDGEARLWDGTIFKIQQGRLYFVYHPI